MDQNAKADPLGGLIPQERVTGDILRGRGPRRGNLERLLRYWRPIMNKPGGFRRCRVILADHPELYPLNNICAWLHHETTGLWPNEGCHHPTMKNCRGKLKKRNWTNAEFLKRVSKPINPPGGLGKLKGLTWGDDDEEFFSTKQWRAPEELSPVITGMDKEYAMLVLKDFIEMEPYFVKYLRDNDSWEIVGKNYDNNEVSMPYIPTECCGG